MAAAGGWFCATAATTNAPRRRRFLRKNKHTQRTTTQSQSNQKGHDPNDYEIGKRRGLETITIMNKDGSLNAAAGAYAGMDR